MGTRGYRGYRHKRRFIYWYNHWDSYLEGLGLEILAEIPGSDATPEKFQEWLVKIREQMDRLCEEHPDDSEESTRDPNFSREPPRQDLFIKWTYIVDLDNLVFHIDGLPIFRLDHLPPPGIFLDCVGCDHYRNRAYKDDTPVEYRYDWTAPPPPPCVIGLTAYRDHASENENRSIHEILAISEDLSRTERSSTEILEILVGAYMFDQESAIFIHGLENLPSRELMSYETKSYIFSLLSLALYPKIFPRRTPTDVDPSHEFIWLHGRQGSLCLHITTHLDDEANREAAVGKVVNEVLQKSGKGVNIAYGVAFSIFHCVVVSVDIQSGGRCQHTSALQFLPSWYAESPSTPGIVALARLGYHVGFDLSTGSRDPCATILSSPAKRDSGGKFVLPADICDEIVQHLYHPIDILLFGSISPPCKDAAMRILSYPHIANHRLLSRIRAPVERHPYLRLSSADFEAVTESGKVIIQVGIVLDETSEKVSSGCVGFIASPRPNNVFSCPIALYSSQRTLEWQVSGDESEVRI